MANLADAWLAGLAARRLGSGFPPRIGREPASWSLWQHPPHPGIPQSPLAPSPSWYATNPIGGCFLEWTSTIPFHNHNNINIHMRTDITIYFNNHGICRFPGSGTCRAPARRSGGRHAPVPGILQIPLVLIQVRILALTFCNNVSMITNMIYEIAGQGRHLPVLGWLPVLGRLPVLGQLPVLGRLPLLGRSHGLSVTDRHRMLFKKHLSWGNFTGRACN